MVEDGRCGKSLQEFNRIQHQIMETSRIVLEAAQTQEPANCLREVTAT